MSEHKAPLERDPLRWDEGCVGEWRYVDADGRIRGRVIRNIGGREYLASYNDSGLGAYITLEAAQKAVERGHTAL